MFRPKKIHCVGIKGAGMTGLATLFQAMGYTVQGSDTDEVFFTDAILRDLGIPVFLFGENSITKEVDEVIYSTAYTNSNMDMAAARRLDIPVRSYSEALAELFNKKKGILVTGSHGKTTSTAMLGEVLSAAGWDPTVLVGGEVLNWHRTARLGKSEWMITEGDEYQAKILQLRPSVVLITSIDYDHPDFFQDAEAYCDMFRELVKKLPPDAVLVMHESVGEKLSLKKEDMPLRTVFYKQEAVELSVFGAHNELNASGALAVARLLGVDETIARTALRAFKGTKRRLELYTAPDAPVVLIDDYAHHPTEVSAALRAIRKRYPERRITVLFQPHTYSRTEAFLDAFAESFGAANDVIILDVYGSARERKGRALGKELAKKIQQTGQSVKFIPTVEEVSALLKKEDFQNNSLFVSMGAGDVWKVVFTLAM